MGWKLNKEKHMWPAYKAELLRFWYDLRSLNIKELQHSYVNLFVEAFRMFPYTIGHFVALILPVLLLVIGYFNG